MENHNSPSESKPTTFRTPRIAVTIALVICLFTPWLSYCSTKTMSGAEIVFQGITIPAVIPSAFSGGNVDVANIIFLLLAFIASISMILYPILNLRKAIRGTGSAYWRIGSLIGSLLLLILANIWISMPNTRGVDSLMWGYWLTLLVIFAAGIVEVLNIWYPDSPTDDPPSG